MYTGASGHVLRRGRESRHRQTTAQLRYGQGKVRLPFRVGMYYVSHELNIILQVTTTHVNGAQT